MSAVCSFIYIPECVSYVIVKKKVCLQVSAHDEATPVKVRAITPWSQ